MPAENCECPEEARERSEKVGNKGITGFKIYPNPNAGSFTVELPDTSSQTTLMLYKATGQSVKAIQCTGKSTRIEASNLPTGVYFYRLLTSAGCSEDGKIIINK